MMSTGGYGIFKLWNIYLEIESAALHRKAADEYCRAGYSTGGHRRKRLYGDYRAALSPLLPMPRIPNATPSLAE